MFFDVIKEKRKENIWVLFLGVLKAYLTQIKLRNCLMILFSCTAFVFSVFFLF